MNKTNCKCKRGVVTMTKFTQKQMTSFSEQTLSLFVKFIMVCEDNHYRIQWELQNECFDEDYEQELKEKLDHYLLLYRDIKNHTGLTSDELEPFLKEGKD